MSQVASQVAQPGPAAGISRVMWFIAIGIVLPVIALVVEAVTNLSGDTLFDPIPTPFHAFLIALVPVSNLWLLHILSYGQFRHAQKAAWLNALALGVALFYAVLYLPFSPVSAILVIWFGVGFLPLSPLLAVVALIWGRRLLKRGVAQTSVMPGLWRGVGLAWLLLFLAQAPTTVSTIGLHLATSGSPASQLEGIRWLRIAGDEKTLLRLCYERAGVAPDPLSLLLNLGDNISIEQARTAFYRVTGKPFNDFPVPPLRNRRARFFSFDSDVGGEVVGSRTQGVALTGSRIDGSLDAQASTAYLEWTMVFTNAGAVQSEGRGQIQLPPGAVVSRLTLWIDGEEREAAFGGRAEVRKAYTSVVRKNRDPVLVTTQGKDRIMFQLFPIPPNGGEMKVRIGITLPLHLSSPVLAQLRLPALRERNFEIAPGLRHAVWVEAKTELIGTVDLKPEQANAHTFAVRGALEDGKLGHTIIQAGRDVSKNLVWSNDSKSNDSKSNDGKSTDATVVVQQIQQQPAWQPQRAVLVLDGSLSMREHQRQIADALVHFPRQVELGLVIADDAAQAWLPTNGMAASAAMAQIRQFSFVGGRDNLAALTRAWDWALAKPEAAIVWVHGPQPILLESSAALLQFSQRRAHAVRLFQLEAVAGPNLLLDKIDGLPDVYTVPGMGEVGVDLENLFRQWQPGAQQMVVKREKMAANALEVARVAKTSDHLVRLWAADEVARLLQAGQTSQTSQTAQTGSGQQAAIELAQRYQLVTKVTGAVVLETSQQYADAGLAPVAAGSVPTIPEPQTWLMLVLVAGVLLLLYRRRGQSGAASQ